MVVETSLGTIGTGQVVLVALKDDSDSVSHDVISTREELL